MKIKKRKRAGVIPAVKMDACDYSHTEKGQDCPVCEMRSEVDALERERDFRTEERERRMIIETDLEMEVAFSAIEAFNPDEKQVLLYKLVGTLSTIDHHRLEKLICEVKTRSANRRTWE